MLQSIGVNELLQLDADLQTLVAQGDPKGSLAAIQQRVVSWINQEQGTSIQVLQAALQQANDEIKRLKGAG